MTDMNELNTQTLERLMQYYQVISENWDLKKESISSSQLAKFLSMDDTQVRKDMAAIEVKGQRHIGFNAQEVLEKIRWVLGFTDSYRAVLLGAGQLGGAIASYEGFAKYGLKIEALFDNDPGKVGLVVAGHVVQPLEQLETIIRDRCITLAILTVPAEAAQQTADRLVTAGVKAIWSFSPVGLEVPKEVIVRHEHLSMGLARLSYHLRRMNDGGH